MREIFAIKTLFHNRRYKMEPTSKANQQFVYLLNIMHMHIYVVAKLLTFFCVCFEFSTWVLNFAWLLFTIAKNAKLSTD